MHPIPGYTQMPALISVYWDDLQADQGTGDVYFQSLAVHQTVTGDSMAQPSFSRRFYLASLLDFK
jgi:hypothetical protein